LSTQLLTTAKALGIDIPATLLSRADDLVGDEELSKLLRWPTSSCD
jgi:hypothetical protein